MKREEFAMGMIEGENDLDLLREAGDGNTEAIRKLLRFARMRHAIEDVSVIGAVTHVFLMKLQEKEKIKKALRESGTSVKELRILFPNYF